MNTQIQFGPFRLDQKTGELFKDGRRIRVQQHPLNLLRILLDRQGELVTRDDIREQLWPNGVVVDFEHSINSAVNKLRVALADTAENPRYVETVSRKGYRFLPPVERTGSPAVIPACVQDVSAELRPATTAKTNPEPAVQDSEGPELSLSASRPSKLATISVVLSLVAVVAIAVLWKSKSDRDWAAASVAQVELLASAGQYQEGYQLALQILQYLPAEKRVSRLLTDLSDDLNISSSPQGAQVYLQRLGVSGSVQIGSTPIQHLTVPRGEFIVSLKKYGYADFERTVSSSLDRLNRTNGSPWSIRIEQPLYESSLIPKEMVIVPGGKHRLMGWSRTGELTATLSDFLIDKFEVRNLDFKRFIDAGGYGQRQFWDPRFAGPFRDSTGLSGPRVWAGGTFPDGKDGHPVTGVTWPEASAYCRFHGKELPSLFQWERAARGTSYSPFGIHVPWGLLNPGDLARRANVETTGTAPVDSFRFGMSQFGVYNTAGNVEEWTRNPYDDGFTIAGGGWNDPIYQYGKYWPRPALHSAATLGFRCAMTPEPVTADQGAMRLSSAASPLDYPVSSSREFQIAKHRYSYEKTPLRAVVLGTEETESWRREDIEFDGFGGERAKAFLYLPKNSAPPYQVIHFLGGGSWWLGVPITEAVESRASRIAPHIRAGRAVFLVVLKGFAGREPVGEFAKFDYASAKHRDILLPWTVDMQRGVDYLEARPDIDQKRIALVNHSTFPVSSVFAAVDTRYSALILIGAGVFPELLTVRADANPLHFIPHIRIPKLLLNGVYDDNTTQSAVLALFRLMRGSKKRESYIGGHIPPLEIGVPRIRNFLDETLGPVTLK